MKGVFSRVMAEDSFLPLNKNPPLGTARQILGKLKSYLDLQKLKDKLIIKMIRKSKSVSA
jgi:hypothetical protein